MDPVLEEKAARFPNAPGVYLIRDAAGRIIYVGKARSLKQRIRYYLAQKGAPPRLRALQARMHDLECLVTDSEVEALILECTLIKEHRPRYNIYLKDDKDYPYLRLTGELYPRLQYLRLSQKEKEDRRYGRSGAGLIPERERLFGPYTNAGAVRETVRLLGKVFPLRRCRRPLDGRPGPGRPCLNFQMGRCLAPCRGKEVVAPEEYGQLVQRVVLFLEGRQRELEQDLEQRMHAAAGAETFEKAAALRDQLQALRWVMDQDQKVLSMAGADQDVLALVREKKEAAVHLFRIREGRLLGQEHFALSGAAGVPDGEALAAFIKHYYSRADRVPLEILLSHSPDERQLLLQWLQQRGHTRVAVKVPVRGPRKELVELACRNGLLRLKEAITTTGQREETPLRELARLAGIDKIPQRIEGFDISHLRGAEAVGSMVVFREGRPARDQYRYFYLRHTPVGDDYAALQEVLRRRWAHKDWPRPDLILVDGGRGQLAAARRVLVETGAGRQPLVALAEKPEQIFLEGQPAPLLLPAHHAVLQLLQRIRDEAHRFALNYHRRLYRRKALRSSLEQIPGIGPKRRVALLKHFGSVEQLLRAAPEEIATVSGFSSVLAERVFRFLHEGV